MKCPNCNREMVNKSYSQLEEFYHWEDEEFYYRNVFYEKLLCYNCKIRFKDDNWDIPEYLLPTEKQKKTILFINNHLKMNLKALTKFQCWKDINQYFEKAKKVPLHSDEEWIEIQEYYGIDEGDFC